MVIKRITLQNYRRFAYLQLEFPENLIGIVGKNGSGKSTLVEAIGWALYGNRMARTDKIDIRSQFAGESEACFVELEFAYAGHEYRIVRKLKGKNAVIEAALYRSDNEEAQAVRNEGVNEYVEQLLHLDYRSFLASVFARQRELASLSSMQAEERRKSIHRLINIEQIDRARENVRRDAKSKKDFLDGLKRGLLDLKELQSRLDANREIIETEQKELASFMVQADAKEKLSQSARQNLEEKTQRRDLYHQYEKRMGEINSRIAENETALIRLHRDLSEISQAEKNFANLQKIVKDFMSVKGAKEKCDYEQTRFLQLEGLLGKKQQLETIIKEMQNQIEEMSMRIAAEPKLSESMQLCIEQEKALEKNGQAGQSNQAQILGKLEATGQAGQELKAKLEQIIRLGPDGECPTCTQRLTGHYDHVVNQMEKQLQILRQEYASALTSNKQKEQQLAELGAKRNQVRVEKENLLQLLSGLREASANLQRIRLDMDRPQKQIVQLEQELVRFGQVDYDSQRHQHLNRRYDELLPLQQEAAQMQERAGRRIGVEADIRLITQTIADLRDQYEAERLNQQKLQFSESDYENLKRVVFESNKDFMVAKDATAQRRELLAGLKKEEQGLFEMISVQQDRRQEIANIEKDLFYLNALDVHFGQFRLDLARRVRPLIAARASELLGLTTAGRYSLMELDEDYQISIYDGNTPFSVGRFSGGEQDVANLCLRIAISQIVAERSGGAAVNFIILDEIFGSQDDERKNLILQALGQLSSQFQQIFIITHVEAIKDVLPVMVEMTLTDEGVSEARMV